MKQLIFKRYRVLILLMTLIFNNTGCKKFLDADYKTQVSTQVVFATDANASAAITGLYAHVGNSQYFNGIITQECGFAADELTYTSSDDEYFQFINNQILPTNTISQNLFADYYKAIYEANSIIENASASTGMSAAYKKQIINEAEFIRAFCHFYLVNLYGPVPLITVTDKSKTISAPRSPVADVYAQIKTDLNDAYNNLPADYSVSSGSRIRVNKWGAAALLARVYLYTQDYPNAEAMATAVLANTSLYSLLSDQNQVFLKNHNESILEWDRSYLANTLEGGLFLNYPSYGLPADHAMLPGLLSAFPSGDTRKDNWTIQFAGDISAVPYKYKADGSATTVTENYLVLRVAEQYLIRAEAYAQQNKVAAAQADLNKIRNRAGLANTTATDKTTLMAAVEQERRVELFCEWGHRWFDLKRWPSLVSPGTKTRADDVIGSLKTTWKPTSVLFPIPQYALINNPNLTQNSGY